MLYGLCAGSHKLTKTTAGRTFSWTKILGNALLKVRSTVETTLKAKLLGLKAGGNGQKDSPAVGSLIVHDFGKSDVRIMLVNKVYEGKTRDGETVRPL